jgi:hypothetical protein
MTPRRIALAFLALAALLARHAARADDVRQVRHHAPACPPGCQVVEETCFREVARDVCKVVPDVVKVKKWVYSCVDEPFCVPGAGKSPHGLLHHDKCDATCPTCTGPYCRKLLVKREVVVKEIPTTKCVVEKVVERVPYTVYHVQPCGTPCPPGMTIVESAPAVEVLKTPPRRQK